MIRAKICDTSLAAACFCRVAVLLLFAGAPGLAHAVDFKGIELGETLWMSQERDVFGDLDCNPLKLRDKDYQDYVLDMQAVVPGAKQVCIATTTIATVPADVTVILGVSRRVLRMTFQFESESYPLILRAMSEKWGEGIHEVRGEADQSVWWDFSDGSTISVHQSPAEDTQQNELSSVGLVEYMLPNRIPANDL